MSEFTRLQRNFDVPVSCGAINIFHMGRGISRGKDVVPNHYHGTLYEVNYAVSGKGTNYAGDVAQQIEKGDVFVNFPLENHMVESDDKELLHYVFISFRFINRYFEQKFENFWLNKLPPKNRVFHDERFYDIMTSIINEIENPDKYSQNIINARADEMIVYIIRVMNNRVTQSLSQKPNEDELCRHMQHYIDSHLYSIKHLSELADVFRYSYNYLSGIFRKNVGMTISEYYIEKRMSVARLLINANEKSISEISDMLGFSGVYSFSKAFKAYYGVSPKYFSDSKVDGKAHIYGKNLKYKSDKNI